jgi:endonuclease/exonuclease/phosphatase family metal-dependent hydrolase
VTPLLLNDDNAAAAAERRANHEFMLASWNIRNISNKKTDANLQKIANLVQKFDFLAVQEVRDVEVMGRLKALV